MTDTNKETNLEVSQEEQNADKEAMVEVSEDDLRSSLAEKYGLDGDTEGELLDKLVADNKEQKSKLSGAIKQKIKHRTRAEELAAGKKLSTPDKPADKPADKGDSKDDDFDTKFAKKMAERDLKELDLPETIETEVRKVAEVQGISMREAAKDPYITSRMEKHAKDERVKNSSPNRKNKGGLMSDFDPSKPLDAANFDFNTEEGRNAWEEAKKKKAVYRKNS